jgi:predicted nucleotidyltransferase
LARANLRDRDGIITGEGLIFRVFGYSHPEKAYICDAEYASANIFSSTDPRAPRTGGKQLFYKFYNDEGMKLVFEKYPQYTVLHKMLNQKVLGVKHEDILEARKPEKRLQALLEIESKDKLVDATVRVLNKVTQNSGVPAKCLGVFGSMLHGFHHPDFSDIDLIVYGRKENAAVRETLEVMYAEPYSEFRNEFESEHAMEGKRWRFKNLSVKEFVWHQKRKLIYGLFDDKKSGRITKAEFEPVKTWSEIVSEYNPKSCIVPKGWTRIKARVVDDFDAPFIPSVYGIEPLEVLEGSRDALEAARVFSYMEEFRQQVQKDEVVIVEGNLEEVVSPGGSFRQVTLTYCPRYYEQVLKVSGLDV